MTIMEMLGQSGVLTVLGMGVVFGFLIIMIITISVAGKMLRALGVADEVVKISAAAIAATNDVPVAAISAAVSEYRKSNQ